MEFEGSSFFRQRIVCSVLSSKTIKINNIRSHEKTPGLTGMFTFNFIRKFLYSYILDYEVSLLRLIDKITNGTKIEIDSVGMCCVFSLHLLITILGTKLFFKPGMLTGGKIKHDCPNSRSIGYYLEALVLLAPFGKEPLNIVLNGITNHMDNLDISVYF